jgi:hypothetical protein
MALAFLLTPIKIYIPRRPEVILLHFKAPQKQGIPYVIPLRITGKLSDQPRTVLLKTAEGTTATAGVDFELKEVTIPPGVFIFNYPLILINSVGMASNVYRIVLEPAETKDFTLGTLGTDTPV